MPDRERMVKVFVSLDICRLVCFWLCQVFVYADVAVCVCVSVCTSGCAPGPACTVKLYLRDHLWVHIGLSLNTGGQHENTGFV